jgi:hypothetical protein
VLRSVEDKTGHEVKVVFFAHKKDDVKLIKRENEGAERPALPTPAPRPAPGRGTGRVHRCDGSAQEGATVVADVSEYV